MLQALLEASVEALQRDPRSAPALDALPALLQLSGAFDELGGW